MDAYGSSGGASTGQIVAINTCNGNPAQDWTIWSNGSVSVWGLCVDTKGGTSSVGTPLVNLEQCDGSSSQAWQQGSGSVLNSATTDCLDAPNADSSPGTQLDIYTCNGTTAQKWQLPGSGSPPASGSMPCDIYATYNTPCVGAYSTTRALYAGYDGSLYQVQRASDGSTANIGLLSTGGDVNAAAQDSFCSNTTCTITEIYDQSPEGNHLTIEGAGGAAGADHGASATALPITIGGHEAYGVGFTGGIGYRDDSPKGTAVNGQPEGAYMVASGTYVNSACCFDFGNMETNNNDTGAGHMDALNLSTTCWASPCAGAGPWVQVDMENGIYMSNNTSNLNNTGNNSSFVTAMMQNNGQTTFAIEGGNSQSGGLSTWYDGPLPPGYSPMRQEGAIGLGTGGDNSNSGVGSFFEGVMTAGYPTTTAIDDVQANIVAAGYSGNTVPPAGTGSGGGGGVPCSNNTDSAANAPYAAAAATDAAIGVMPSAANQAVVHLGFTSVYTIDGKTGHLDETYLSAMCRNWQVQDLSANFGTPPVLSGTQPVALVHCGYTSVFTVDGGSGDLGDLQETYLPNAGFPGDPWSTQDLSKNYGVPPTGWTPTAVEHYAGVSGTSSGCGYTSVYTVDASNSHLQETFLPNAGFPGDPWLTQDLSAKYGTPAAMLGTSPVAAVHCGYTSVYTVDSDGDLQETYLSANGNPWGTQDLSAKYGTPRTYMTPTAVEHFQGTTGTSAGCGWTSVYTVNQGSNDLQETYLSPNGFPGNPWGTQNLSVNYGTPPVEPGVPPVALYHLGWTSVYTVDPDGDLQETYLPNNGFPGDPWATQSLSKNYLTPATNAAPIPLLHLDTAGNLDWSSVFTFNANTGDLEETYLPPSGFPGDIWITQDLSVGYGTPSVLRP